MKIAESTRWAASVVTMAAVMFVSSVRAEDAAAAPAAPKSPWESSAALGLTLTRGNSETELFTAKVDAARKKDKEELALGVDIAYGKSSGVKNTESYHAFGQYNHLLSDKAYVYGRLDGLRDEIAGLDYRLTFSPGAGYYFIKNDKTLLSAEAGPGVVYERQEGSDPETYGTLRLAENFEHKINASVKVWQKAEVQPQLDRWKNFVVNAEVGIEAGLTAKSSLRVYLQDTYDNEPAPGRKANDLKTVAALAYKF